MLYPSLALKHSYNAITYMYVYRYMYQLEEERI